LVEADLSFNQDCERAVENTTQKNSVDFFCDVDLVCSVTDAHAPEEGNDTVDSRVHRLERKLEGLGQLWKVAFTVTLSAKVLPSVLKFVLADREPF